MNNNIANVRPPHIALVVKDIVIQQFCNVATEREDQTMIAALDNNHEFIIDKLVWSIGQIGTTNGLQVVQTAFLLSFFMSVCNNKTQTALTKSFS